MKSVIKSNALFLDCEYLTIIDTSEYNPDVPIENPILRIELPNFNKYVDIPYTPKAVNNINSNLLKLTTTKCDLPSGVYTITQSICPNDKLSTTYSVLNVCPDMKTLGCALCDVGSSDPDKYKEFHELLMSLDIAKFLIEKCNNLTDGVELYNITSKKISKLKDCNC